MAVLRRPAPIDLIAVLIAVGAAVAGLVVWNHGQVSLGLTLAEQDGRVVVADVTPDGHAHRQWLYPGTPIIELTTVDGSPVERGAALRELFERANDGMPPDDEWFVGYEFGQYGPDFRPPVEAVPTGRIESVIAGDIDPWCCVGEMGSLYRSALEGELRRSVWTAAIGLLLGGLVWRLLAHGMAGDIGRRLGIVVGAAVATPFVVVPTLQGGAAAGIATGYLFTAAAAMVVGFRLAFTHADPQWRQTGAAAAVVAAGLAAVVTIRYLGTPSLTGDDRTPILLLIAAAGLAPGAIAATSRGRTAHERLSLVLVGLMPAAAALLFGSATFDASSPLLALTTLAVAHTLPVGARVMGIGRSVSQRIGQRVEEFRTQASATPVAHADPATAETRDFLTYGLLALSVVISVAMPSGGPLDGPGSIGASGAWPIIVGVGLAAIVGFAVRRGFLGDAWTDAAVPLAAAVGIPVILVNGLSYYGRTPLAVIPTAFAALAVAHVLAVRHSDPVWRNRLFAASAVLVGLISILSMAGGESLATVLIGFVALIPGALAFGGDPDEPRALNTRLETLAVAITPGAAATMLAPSIGLLLLGGWLVAIVVWRQFTVAPMLGLAVRSQLQRDVAVAAAETERARLAADLHDDALQQLTMLVRTLDEKGQKQEADEAREIATKLRSVVGDLRLPILDDLGAGAALEWLVERVEPLAGGPVKLERSDESRPPANVELAVFRVAQEALTNAIKHGRPPIAVRYDVRTDGRVTLAIDDAGEGIGSEAAEEAPKAGHFGLVNMQQRAEQIGALLDVRRWPAGGTRVALEWRPQ
jgi:signal transduction histidine kinase